MASKSGSGRRPDERSVRDRILDAAVGLIGDADDTDFVSFAGPKRSAAAAGASVGGLYHHWSAGTSAFASDVVGRARAVAARVFAAEVVDAIDLDDLARRVVAGARGAPAAAALALAAPDSAGIVSAVEAVLARAQRTPRAPWTSARISALLASVAVGSVAVGDAASDVVGDAVRLVLMATSAGAGDLRDFSAILTALDAGSRAAGGWSAARRTPSVRLGLDIGTSRAAPRPEPSEESDVDTIELL